MTELKLGTVLHASLAGKAISGHWAANPKLRGPGLAVLERARLTCEGCGFRSVAKGDVAHGWMVPVNPDHPALLVTNAAKGICLCPFCASSMALNWAVAPVEQGGKLTPPPGMLINMPHMSQAQVNRLALHVVSVLASRRINKQTPIEIAAINIDNAFISLNSDLAGSLKVYRNGEDANYARALSLLPQEFYQYRDEIIAPVRWWPAMDVWREQGLFWMASTYADFHKAV